MIHFLIDYENRNEYGLAGIKGLSEDAHVYILFSQNACKLDLNVISETVAKIHAVKVQPGRQSLDMHLVSCLGFLLNQYGTDDEYFVISDDTDFDKVIDFWKGRGYKVSRVKSIEVSASPEAVPAPAEPVRKKRASSRGKKAAAPVTVESTVKEAPAETAAVAETVAQPVETPKEAGETEKEEILTPAVSEEAAVTEGVQEKEETKVAEVTEGKAAKTAGKRKKAAAAKTKKQPVTEKAETEASKNESAEAAPEQAPKGTEAAESHEDAKQKKQAPLAKAKTQPESVAINSRIQKFLAQNKVNGAAINAIASIVAGNAGKKDRKALIYRQIIKKFGQKAGLEYYKMLKSEL